jgi:hypothetical protein
MDIKKSVQTRAFASFAATATHVVGDAMAPALPS